jgi:hypothetical protein
VAGFPLDKQYTVHDLRTGVVHMAQAWDDGGQFGATVVHATFCNIVITQDWRLCEKSEHPTCLECVTEAG